MGFSGTATKPASRTENKKPHLFDVYMIGFCTGHTRREPRRGSMHPESSFFHSIDPFYGVGLFTAGELLWYAFVCSACSVIGGAIGYSIGWQLWNLVSDFFFMHVPGFTHEVFDLVGRKYNENAFLAVFTAAFTPIPYKVFTIAGGVFQINFLEFILASIIGRSMRFFLVAGLIRKFGASIKATIDKYFDWMALGFTALLVLGFLVIKYAL
jgi:membrane protein YqaA with SNARE-associated domain